MLTTMRLKVRLETARIDFNSYRKELQRNFSELITLAAVEWIQAAIEVIPVWSGASHATFLHLAREAGYNLSINEKPNAPRRVNLGLRTSDGEININAESGEFSFRYETDLRHLNTNERRRVTPDTDPSLFTDLITPGPYNFRRQARDVAVNILMSGKLPNLFKHMKVKRFRSG